MAVIPIMATRGDRGVRSRHMPYAAALHSAYSAAKTLTAPVRSVRHQMPVYGIRDVDVLAAYPLDYVNDRNATGQESRDERVPQAVRSEFLGMPSLRARRGRRCRNSRCTGRRRRCGSAQIHRPPTVNLQLTALQPSEPWSVIKVRSYADAAGSSLHQRGDPRTPS